MVDNELTTSALHYCDSLCERVVGVLGHKVGSNAVLTFLKRSKEQCSSTVSVHAKNLQSPQMAFLVGLMCLRAWTSWKAETKDFKDMCFNHEGHR